MGGALLGTSRKIPKTKEDSRKIAEIFEQFHITALIIIGGWEAVKVCNRMQTYIHPDEVFFSKGLTSIGEA